LLHTTAHHCFLECFSSKETVVVFVAAGLDFDPSVELYPGDYCTIINDLTENRCFETSLLGMTLSRQPFCPIHVRCHPTSPPPFYWHDLQLAWHDLTPPPPHGEGRAGICKHFKEPKNRLPAWRAGTTTLFVILSRQAV
jgi:hypothetical protein